MVRNQLANAAPVRPRLFLPVDGERISGILEFADVDDVVRAIEDKIDLDAVGIRVVALEDPTVRLDVDDADAERLAYLASDYVKIFRLLY